MEGSKMESQLAADLAEENLSYPEAIGQWTQDRSLVALVLGGILYDPDYHRPDHLEDPQFAGLNHPLLCQPRPRAGLLETWAFIETAQILADLAIRLAVPEDNPLTDPRFADCPVKTDPVRWLWQSAFTRTDRSKSAIAGAFAVLSAGTYDLPTLAQQMQSLNNREITLIKPGTGSAFGVGAPLPDAKQWLSGPDITPLQAALDQVVAAVHYGLGLTLQSADLSRVLALIFLGPDLFADVEKVLSGNYTKPVTLLTVEQRQPEPPTALELLSSYGFVEPALTDFRQLVAQQVELFRLTQLVKNSPNIGTEVKAKLDELWAEEKQYRDSYARLMTDYRNFLVTMQAQLSRPDQASPASPDQKAQVEQENQIAALVFPDL